MQFYVKFINEADGTKYKDINSLYNLVAYIYGGTKSMFDTVRPGRAMGDYNGCIPFLGPEWLSHDYEAAYNQILLNCQMYGYADKNVDLMKHRVISFNKYEYILPEDADFLAKIIISNLYQDYISVYGVHMNTKQIHIHIGIHTVNIHNGNKFSVSFEKKKMLNIVQQFLDHLNDRIDSEINGHQRYEAYLFNDK